jgi:hypothetical protein
MINTLLVVFFVLLFIFIIGRLFVYPYYHSYWGPQGPDEVTTHTTTTTTTVNDGVVATQPSYNIVGNLVRQWEGTQPYVIDPVDHDKVWLNTSDDMYEDGAGKLWTLS